MTQKICSCASFETLRSSNQSSVRIRKDCSYRVTRVSLGTSPRIPSLAGYKLPSSVMKLKICLHPWLPHELRAMMSIQCNIPLNNIISGCFWGTNSVFVKHYVSTSRLHPEMSTLFHLVNLFFNFCMLSLDTVITMMILHGQINL